MMDSEIVSQSLLLIPHHHHAQQDFIVMEQEIVSMIVLQLFVKVDTNLMDKEDVFQQFIIIQQPHSHLVQMVLHQMDKEDVFQQTFQHFVG
jgi:hypothetical protein